VAAARTAVHAKSAKIAKNSTSKSGVQLVALAKKCLQLERHRSYEILQILRVTLFEHVPIQQLLTTPPAIQTRLSSPFISLSSDKRLDTTDDISSEMIHRSAFRNLALRRHAFDVGRVELAATSPLIVLVMDDGYVSRQDSPGGDGMTCEASTVRRA